MILSALAAAAILPVQSYPFKSEGPLEIKNLTFPATVRQFEPVEITFELSGTWNDPFNPNQVDVTATVIGAENTYSIVSGFVVPRPPQDEIGTANSPSLIWKVRFTPWNIGGYGIFIRVADTKGTIEYRKLGIRVNNGPGGFVQVERNSRYFSLNRSPLLLAGVSDVLDSAADADRIANQMADLKKAGASVIRILWGSNAGQNWRNLSGVCISPDERTFRMAEMLESVLTAAMLTDMNVILALSSADELTPGKGWEKNPFNKANGGPCDKPQEFWTNLQARLLYKRGLRYLLSRLQNFRSIAGIEFFTGVDVPGYWVQEMSNEVAGVHTFLLPMSVHPGAPDVWRVPRVGYASIPVTYRSTPHETAASIVSELRTMRAQTNRPLVPIAESDAPNTESARAALWAPLFGGAATSTIFAKVPVEANFFDPFNRFANRIEWLRRRFQDVVATVDEGMHAWGLADDTGCIALVLPEPDEQIRGAIVMPVRRGGNYEYTWIDIESGEEAGKGQVRSSDGTVVVPMPIGTGGVAGEISRR